MDMTFTVICAALLIWIGVGNPTSSRYKRVADDLSKFPSDRQPEVTERHGQAIMTTRKTNAVAPGDPFQVTFAIGTALGDGRWLSCHAVRSPAS